jgi:hypothetical protein
VIRLAVFATLFSLTAGASHATDCETMPDVEVRAMECWHAWPFAISTAELAYNGYELISTTTIDATPEAERGQGPTAHYEVSYWRGSRFIFQCRSLFRNNGQNLRMTASECRSTQAPPEIGNLWSFLRSNAPER